MSLGAHVLVVEDDPKIAGVLVDYLRAAGMRATCLASGLEVAEVVRREAPDLVLLDLMLPGKGGLDVCREVRAFSDVPIVMVTALVEEIDRLLGLELGADDYVCKPFSPREVVARVRAVLRRPRGGPPSSAGVGAVMGVAGGEQGEPPRAIGPFVIDEGRMKIAYEGQRLELTTSEYRLLRRLVLAPGRVFSRAQLLTELHGSDAEAFDRAIDTHVKNLRKKLARVAPDANVLRSVYGVGYQIEIE